MKTHKLSIVRKRLNSSYKNTVVNMHDTINHHFNYVSKNLNPRRFVNNHLLSEEKSVIHKALLGIIIVFLGVSITKIPTSYHIIEIALDGIGYSVHGIGCIPLIDHLSKKISSHFKEK